MGGSTPDEARAALAAARPIREEELQEGAELWRQYASPSPLAFDAARRRGSRVFPELTSSAELHGSWFSRVRGERLHLSDLDEVLLGHADDSWRTTVDILRRLSPEQNAQLTTFDAFFSVERLRAWAAHGALEREARDDDSPFEQDSFRATVGTRRLLEHGLDSVVDAPPLYVGGCRVNDPATPWVRVTDQDGWRLAPFR